MDDGGFWLDPQACLDAMIGARRSDVVDDDSSVHSRDVIEARTLEEDGRSSLHGSVPGGTRAEGAAR
jgi:hypothetical protein